MTAVAEKAPTEPTFQRRLGLFDSTMLIMGTMIGSGIFVTSVEISQNVRSAGWLLTVWGVAGFMTIIGALSYAELAGMMPHAGGQYVYLREAYSPLWGFLYGWTCFLVIQTGSIAAVAVVFGKYLGVWVPMLGTENVLFPPQGFKLPQGFNFTISAGQLVAVGVIAFLTWLNCRGVQEGKIVQNVFTLAKTFALVALIVVGILVVANPVAQTLNGKDWWGGIQEGQKYAEVSKKLGFSGTVVALMVVGGAMVGALFSADAWNNITFTAGEIRNPRRNMPLSLAIGTSTVILLYLLANVAYVRSLPVVGDPKLDKEVRALDAQEADLLAEGKKTEAEKVTKTRKALLDRASTEDRGIAYAKEQRVGSAVLELWSPRFGSRLMALAIMISTFGCVNGMSLMGARLYYAMAQDGLFFRSAGHLNRQGVPAVGLVLQGIWATLLVFSGTYDELLDYVIFAVLVFYVLTVTGLFILRRKHPDAERPYRAVGYPVLPALYVLLCAVIMLDLLIVKPKFTWPGLIIVLSGIPIYFAFRHRFRAATP